MIHVAPPDYHVLVERGQVPLSVEGPVHHSRPAIDASFETAECGDKPQAAIATGHADLVDDLPGPGRRLCKLSREAGR